jgi:signal transduction histidine kinase
VLAAGDNSRGQCEVSSWSDIVAVAAGSSLFRARELAQSSLQETEIDLIVEQERTRIARDLQCES